MGGEVQRESKRMRRTRGSTDNRAGRLKGGQLLGASNSSTFARAGQLDQPKLSLFAPGNSGGL